MNQNEVVSETIDLRGLKCPLPLLKTKKRLKSLGSTEVIVVLADDPESSDDFNEYFGISNKYSLVKESKFDGYFEFQISCK